MRQVARLRSVLRAVPRTAHVEATAGEKGSDAVAATAQASAAATVAFLVGGGAVAAGLTWSQLAPEPSFQNADAVFKKIDLNNNGTVDRQELSKYLTKHGVIDKEIFESIWYAVDTKHDGRIDLQEFREFHKRASRSFALRLYTSLRADPTFLGSCMYLGGSILFPIIPYATIVKPQTLTMLGQGLYLAGGCLFLSTCVQRHVDRLQVQNRFEDAISR